MAETAEQLFRDHYRYVLRLATSLTGDADLARDIAQDVFVAVLKGHDRFRGDSTARTWIYQITIRISGRQLARRRRTSGVALDPDQFPGLAAAEGKTQLLELVAALNQLPLSARTVLSLVAIEGLSHQAAAEVLGVPVGTVWSRLHSARRKLSVLLSPDQSGGHAKSL